jgi:hypothetical protein
VASAQGRPRVRPPKRDQAALQPLPAPPTPRTEVAGEVARYFGAVSILVVGAVHAQQ